MTWQPARANSAIVRNADSILSGKSSIREQEEISGLLSPQLQSCTARDFACDSTGRADPHAKRAERMISVPLTSSPLAPRSPTRPAVGTLWRAIGAFIRQKTPPCSCSLCPAFQDRALQASQLKVSPPSGHPGGASACLLYRALDSPSPNCCRRFLQNSHRP